MHIQKNNHFLGVDIGSSFTKFVVIDAGHHVLFQKAIKTLNRDKHAKQNILDHIFSTFKIACTCATGYGREYFKNADLTKTEIYAASAGVTLSSPILKTIIDIGGEDIKILKSDANGLVLDFYMNTKCAAGTGTFITEIAKRAEIPLDKMSELAAQSDFEKELNSFCTVFAKTEIMQWIFSEVPVKDLAKGIYISIVNRIAKIRMDRTVPVFLIGGVAQFHPFIKNVMEDKFNVSVAIPQNPQMINAFGAAFLAKRHSEKSKRKLTINERIPR